MNISRLHWTANEILLKIIVALVVFFVSPVRGNAQGRDFEDTLSQMMAVSKTLVTVTGRCEMHIIADEKTGCSDVIIFNVAYSGVTSVTIVNDDLNMQYSGKFILESADRELKILVDKVRFFEPDVAVRVIPVKGYCDFRFSDDSGDFVEKIACRVVDFEDTEMRMEFNGIGRKLQKLKGGGILLRSRT
jgi:hypothetical protein